MAAASTEKLLGLRLHLEPTGPDNSELICDDEIYLYMQDTSVIPARLLVSPNILAASNLIFSGCPLIERMLSLCNMKSTNEALEMKTFFMILAYFCLQKYEKSKKNYHWGSNKIQQQYICI